MNYCKASCKYKLFPSSHAVQQTSSGWDFSGLKSKILRFLEKEIPISYSSVSNEHGFQCTGLHQPHKHAKRNAASEQSEERGKYCQQSTEVVRFGQVKPKQSLCCHRRSSMIFQVWLISKLRCLSTTLESCWSLRYNSIYLTRHIIRHKVWFQRSQHEQEWNFSHCKAGRIYPGLYLGGTHRSSWDLLWEAGM